ncbi:MAG: DivIVA domain-containing protein [Negativibacillus sp.]
MDKQVIFKSALNGFEKTAVLKYIDELNSQFAEKESQFQQQTNEWEKEKESLMDQVASLGVFSRELQKKLDAEKQKQQEAEAGSADLKEQLRKLQQENEEKEQELIMQREQNRLIRDQAQTVEIKSKKYDEAAASIGDVILEARQEASRINADARSKADLIVAQAQEKAAQIVADAKNDLCDIQKQMDELREQFFAIRKQMNASVSLLNEQFDRIEAEMTADGAENSFLEEENGEEGFAEAEKTSEEGKAEHPLKSILEQAAASAQKAQLGERAKQLQDLGQKVKETVKESMNMMEKL